MRFPEHDREQQDPPCPTCSVERFGGHSGGETPGPIPNPEVKPSSADGTALETGWESRTSPRLLGKEPPVMGGSLRFQPQRRPGWPGPAGRTGRSTPKPATLDACLERSSP